MHPSSKYYTLLVARTARWQRSHPHQIIRQTLTTLLPIVMIGAWAQALQLSVFTRAGFFAQIYALPHRIPYYSQISAVLTVIETCTLGIIGLITALLAARATARMHGREGTLEALTGAVTFLMLNTVSSRSGAITLRIDNLGFHGLLAGLLCGMLVGWLCHFGRRNHGAQQPLNMDGWGIMATIVGISAALRVALNTFANHGLTGAFYSITTFISVKHVHASIRIGIITLFNNILSWLGIPGPIDPLSPFVGGARSDANLSYALTHGTLANVPYPITMTTIYRPFAMYGGIGMVLALIIAVLITSHERTQRRFALLSLGPGLVNVGTPMLLGFPVLLNPIMLVPYTLTPAVSMFIAWCALKLHLMAPAVYNIPNTTPGPLAAFLATDGNWPALIVAMICLVVAVLIYLPFVRLAFAATALNAKGDDQNA